MDRAAAIVQIRQGLGFRDAARNDEIIQRLQQAQRLLEKGKTLPEFLRVSDEPLLVPQGDAVLDLPDRFIRVAEPPVYIAEDTLSRYALERVDRRVGMTRFPSVSASYPTAYRIDPGDISLWIYPARDRDYTLTWSYYQGGQILDADIENVWLAENPDILIGKAGMLMAEDLRNAAALTKFTKLHQEAWVSGFADDEQDRASDAPLYMGENL